MFKYKQFTIDDSNSAMKVGTDGTMLGCWANVSEARTILDVGCGSGVLTAICAQKNQMASIIGLDVEKGAVIDASSNVSNLPDSWKKRITILRSRLQDYKPATKMDMLISNPPFFENSQISPDDARNFARHTNSLHYSDIFDFALNHLAMEGTINLVLPHENALEAIVVGRQIGFYPSRKCTVHPIPSKAPHRMLIELVKTESVLCEETELTIETGLKRHDYTEEYKDLGREFYLYF